MQEMKMLNFKINVLYKFHNSFVLSISSFYLFRGYYLTMMMMMMMISLVLFKVEPPR